MTNKKTLYIIVLFAVMAAISMSRAQDKPDIPTLSQVTDIFLSCYNGWTLDIYPDGSACLVYGSSIGDNATAPKQTFLFESIYGLIVPHLSRTYHPEQSVAVALHRKNATPGTPTYALYLDDKGAIKQIMSETRDKSMPLDRNRFKQLLEKHSPVPSYAE